MLTPINQSMFNNFTRALTTFNLEGDVTSLLFKGAHREKWKTREKLGDFWEKLMVNWKQNDNF